LEREGNPERMSEAEEEIVRYFFANHFPIPQPDFPIVYASDPSIASQIPINAQTSNPTSTGGGNQDSMIPDIKPQVQTPRFGFKGGVLKIIDEHYPPSNESYHKNAISIIAARNAWENPRLVPRGSSAPAEKDQAVVQATIDAWTLAFMWDYAADGDRLVNEVTTKDGNEPAIWKNFEQCYMAAPMVGVLA
jgi:hypothetical protein